MTGIGSIGIQSATATSGAKDSEPQLQQSASGDSSAQAAKEGGSSPATTGQHVDKHV